MTSAAHIRIAIRKQDIKTARALLKDELRTHPTSELYYLASQVVTSDEQKRGLLEKALKLDPNNREADDALYELDNPAMPEDDPFNSGVVFYADAEKQKQASEAVKRARDYTSVDDYRMDRRRNVDRYPKAGIFTRFIAQLIDGFILNIIAFIAGFVIGLVFPPPTLSEFNSVAAYEEAAMRWQLFSIVISLTISVLYYIYYLPNNDGQTPGKSAMNIQIVKLDGTKLTVGDALLRNIIGYTLSAVFLMLGYIWAIFDGQKQAWHDKLVKTVVIRT